MGKRSGWRDVFRIWSVYVGVVIGAGFASGQEIVAYFTIYGKRWMAGMAVAGLLFGLAGWSVLRLVRNQGLESYGDFMRFTLGRTLGLLMEWVCGLFLLALFCTMAAAAGTLLQELSGLPRWAGAGLLLLACMAVFCRGTAGVVAVSSVLAPLMLVGGGCLALYAVGLKALPAFSPAAGLWRFSKTWLFSAWIYVSYNMVTAVSVLLPLGAYLKDRRTPMRAGLLSGLAMALLGGGLGMALYRNQAILSGAELPLLRLLSASPGLVRGLYLFFFLAAVLTTAVGNGFGALRFFQERAPRLGPWLPFLLPGAALLASAWEFSRWVSVVYPLFGYLGLLQLAVLLASFWKS